MTNAMTVRDGEGELSVEGIKHTKEQLDLFAQLVKETLVRDQDYGVIPGTNSWSLLKPGAANIIAAFGCHSEPFIETTTIDPSIGTYGFINYEVRCEIVLNSPDPTTRLVRAVGHGACNSYEDKYRYRNALAKCPACGRENIRVSKQGGGFYCWAKTDGCGSNFSAAEERITSQVSGKVENENPFEQANTYKKMAIKRAEVDAALRLPGAARFFTQDMEANESDGEAPQSPPQPRRAASPPSRAPLPAEEVGTAPQVSRSSLLNPKRPGDLLPWAARTHELTGPQVFHILGVQNTGEVPDLAAAVQAINDAQGQVIEGSYSDEDANNTGG